VAERFIFSSCSALFVLYFIFCLRTHSIPKAADEAIHIQIWTSLVWELQDQSSRIWKRHLCLICGLTLSKIPKCQMPQSFHLGAYKSCQAISCQEITVGLLAAFALLPLSVFGGGGGRAAMLRR